MLSKIVVAGATGEVITTEGPCAKEFWDRIEKSKQRIREDSSCLFIGRSVFIR